METINNSWLERFRHQLWLEHIEVIDELHYKGNISFVLKSPILHGSEILALIKIRHFSIINLYHDGMLRMHILCNDDY